MALFSVVACGYLISKVDATQVCNCGGLHDGGPIVIETGRTIKWWIGEGTFAGTDRKTTLKLVRQGVKEFDQVCDLDFEEVDNKSKARVKIEFKTDIDALGQAWSSGRIEFNSTRRINRIADRRIIQALTCHELGHVFGLSHNSSIRQAVMHPHLGEHWFPGEVETLQRRHRPPSDDEPTYWPTLRREIGEQLAEEIRQFDRVKMQWQFQFAKRQKFQDLNQWANAQAINGKVKRLHDAMVIRAGKVTEQHRLWWEQNKLWNNSGLANIGKPK